MPPHWWRTKDVAKPSRAPRDRGSGYLSQRAARIAAAAAIAVTGATLAAAPQARADGGAGFPATRAVHWWSAEGRLLTSPGCGCM